MGGQKDKQIDTYEETNYTNKILRAEYLQWVNEHSFYFFFNFATFENFIVKLKNNGVFREKKNQPLECVSIPYPMTFRIYFFQHLAVSRHLCAPLKHPTHLTSSNPSTPHFACSFDFLGAVSFQSLELLNLWMILFQTLHLPSAGSTTNIHGDQVNYVKHINPHKKTYGTKKKTPSAVDISHSIRT